MHVVLAETAGVWMRHEMDRPCVPNTGHWAHYDTAPGLLLIQLRNWSKCHASEQWNIYKLMMFYGIFHRYFLHGMHKPLLKTASASKCNSAIYGCAEVTSLYHSWQQFPLSLALQGVPKTPEGYGVKFISNVKQDETSLSKQSLNQERRGWVLWAEDGPCEQRMGPASTQAAGENKLNLSCKCDFEEQNIIAACKIYIWEQGSW